jgi:hypothetical protein
MWKPLFAAALATVATAILASGCGDRIRQAPVARGAPTDTASSNLPQGTIGPTSVYRQYLAAMRTAARLSDLFPYFSQSQQDFYKRILAQQTPETARAIEAATLVTLRVQGSDAPPSIREVVYSHTATLRVDRPDMSIDVLMVFENSRWTIDKEQVVRMPTF